MQIDETMMLTHMKIQRTVKIIFYTKLFVLNNYMFKVSVVKGKY